MWIQSGSKIVRDLTASKETSEQAVLSVLVQFQVKMTINVKARVAMQRQRFLAAADLDHTRRNPGSVNCLHLNIHGEFPPEAQDGRKVKLRASKPN